jgi:hypothetical protein
MKYRGIEYTVVQGIKRGACGWEQAPRYLIRDRDGAYGEVFRRLRSMGIRDRPTSPRSAPLGKMDMLKG